MVHASCIGRGVSRLYVARLETPQQQLAAEVAKLSSQ
jgi:hypothetical protein